MTSATAVAVLDRKPTETEAEAIALDLVRAEYPYALETLEDSLSWFLSDRLPPGDILGVGIHDLDQLEATLRDTPEGTYLVILYDKP